MKRKEKSGLPYPDNQTFWLLVYYLKCYIYITCNLYNLLSLTFRLHVIYNLLSLGLKFCPTIESDLVAKTSTKLEPVLKQLGHGTESAAAHDVASSLLNNKQKRSNMNSKQKMALKSLKKKSKDIKIVPADKGNAAVIMTNSQYLQKWKSTLTPALTLC